MEFFIFDSLFLLKQYFALCSSISQVNSKIKNM